MSVEHFCATASNITFRCYEMRDGIEFANATLKGEQDKAESEECKYEASSVPLGPRKPSPKRNNRTHLVHHNPMMMKGTRRDPFSQSEP